jgi:hypothetical protein
VVAPYLTHPTRARRDAARITVGSIRGEPPPALVDDQDIDQELHVAHPRRTIRQTALRAVHGRKDRSLFVALVHADRIDALLRGNDGSAPFSWLAWDGIVPTELANEAPSTLLAWAAKTLGPQRELAAITPLVELDRTALRAFHAPPRLTLDEDMREDLLARERAALG